MGAKTKKTRHGGRFSNRSGVRVRKRLNTVESLQRKKQLCPHCNRPGAKRKSSGIWNCSKCGATFASHAYALAARV